MPENKLILAFAGMIGSGKGTACKYFIERYHAQPIRYSQPLRDILDRVYLEHSRDNLQSLSTLLREQFGQDVLAKTVANDATKSDAPMLVIDGVRRSEDILHLQHMPGFTLIAVEASDQVRYARLLGRGENVDDASKSWEQFLKDQVAETEARIPEVMGRATFHIDNNGSVDDLFRQLKKLYGELRAKAQG